MARNGYLAEDGIRLVTVEDNDQLIATAAAAFFAARSAAARDGVTLSIVEPAGAYRSYATQLDMYYHPERYNLNPKNSLKGASPGYSTHGWGNRWDVNSAGLNWMIANGHRYGWTREFGTADPNHFKHDGRTAISGVGLGGFIEEEHPMSSKLVLHRVAKADGTFDQAYYLVDPFTLQRVSDENDITAYREAFGEIVRGDEVGVTPGTALDPFKRMNERNRAAVQGAPVAVQIDYDLLAQKTAALIDFPTTLTIDPPPATGSLS